MRLYILFFGSFFKRFSDIFLTNLFATNDAFTFKNRMLWRRFFFPIHLLLHF